MNNEVFDGKMLAEKLAKLNNSQQSIESLSRWCISHRKKAKQIVESWDKLFKSSQKEQCVSFLYLANDILQNSRKKGSEFVNEFCKVLPASLKQVYQTGDENGKKAVTRLVDIWDERKVFGSKGKNLKDEMLGKNPPSLSVSNGKSSSSNPVKIVKRDAHSVRFKLAVGGLPEKILTAFQSVLDEHLSEDALLNKCNSAALHVSRIENDIKIILSQGNQPGATLLDELQDEENTIHSCIAQLESTEATRSSLTSLLREALLDQESTLEVIRSQLQIARGQIEVASNIRKRLTSVLSPPAMVAGPMTEVSREIQQNISQINSITHQLPVLQSLVSYATHKTTEEENKKAAAAAVAAKLAASASSAQMLTSVLSSLVAEETASRNGGLKGLSIFPPEKRPKLEKPMSASEIGGTEVPTSGFISSMQHQPLTSMPLGPSTSMQAQFASSLPPQPPSLSYTPSVNQYAQSGAMVGATPYGYGSNTLPPPPPLPTHMPMGLARPALHPPQQQQLQPPAGGYYRPLGIGFYSQGPAPQSATSPAPRQ